MAFVKVLARGQVTLPKSVRKALGCKPGDTLLIDPTGPGKAEIELFKPLTLEEMWERYRIDEPMDWAKMREEAEKLAAEEFMRAVERNREPRTDRH